MAADDQVPVVAAASAATELNTYHWNAVAEEVKVLTCL